MTTLVPPVVRRRMLNVKVGDTLAFTDGTDAEVLAIGAPYEVLTRDYHRVTVRGTDRVVRVLTMARYSFWDVRVPG